MNNWFNQNKGQTHLNPDPPHGIDGQCVNAASSWSIAMGGPELMGATAYQIWLNFRHPFFDVIPGTSVQPGDIVFFAPNVSSIGTGYAGHVAVVMSPGFTSADADWGGLPLKQVNHSLAGVVGVFRKRGQDKVTDKGDIINVAQRLWGQNPSDADINKWVGKQFKDWYYAADSDQRTANHIADMQKGVVPYNGVQLYTKQ